MPDGTMIAILKEELPHDYILDGMPRTLNQAIEMAKITKQDVVLLLDVPDAVALDRLSGRMQCENCGNIHGT